MSQDPPRYDIDNPDWQRMKIARAEIEAVLKRRDLAGVVVLHCPGGCEFFYDIAPSYSRVRIDEAASCLRMTSKLADYGGDAEAQLRDQAATGNMTHVLADSLSRAAAMFMEVDREVAKVLKPRHAAAVKVPDPAQGTLQ